MTERLARLLTDHERTQSDLARELNKSRTALSEWKAGRSQPDLETFARLCQLLGVSADEVLGLTPTAAGNRPGRPEVVELALRLREAQQVVEPYLSEDDRKALEEALSRTQRGLAAVRSKERRRQAGRGLSR